MRMYCSFAILLWLLTAAAASAADMVSCGRCGCGEHVRKVCRLVCVMEEEREVVYGCASEDFCIPGPSHKCGCHQACTCGEVRTRRKLVKYEVVKKVPTHKCVVEYLCPHCCAVCAGTVGVRNVPEGFSSIAPLSAACPKEILPLPAAAPAAPPAY